MNKKQKDYLVFLYKKLLILENEAKTEALQAEISKIEKGIQALDPLYNK